MNTTFLEKLLSNHENNGRVRHSLGTLMDSFMKDTTCDENDIASIVGGLTGDDIKAFVNDNESDLSFTKFARLCSLFGAQIDLRSLVKDRAGRPSHKGVNNDTHETVTVEYVEKLPGKEKETYTIKFDSDDPKKVNCTKKVGENEKECVEKKFADKECDNDIKNACCDRNKNKTCRKKARNDNPLFGIICDKKFANTFIDLLGLDDEEDDIDDFIKTFKNLGL